MYPPPFAAQLLRRPHLAASPLWHNYTPPETSRQQPLPLTTTLPRLRPSFSLSRPGTLTSGPIIARDFGINNAPWADIARDYGINNAPWADVARDYSNNNASRRRAFEEPTGGPRRTGKQCR